MEGIILPYSEKFKSEVILFNLSHEDFFENMKEEQNNFTLMFISVQ